MNKKHNKVKNRILSLLVLSVIIALLFSICFVIIEANHDCEGEDCQICHQIYICENLLKSVSKVLISFSLVVFLKSITSSIHHFSRNLGYNSSLITLKIKLLN